MTPATIPHKQRPVVPEKDGRWVEATECPYCEHLNYEVFDIEHHTTCGKCKKKYYVEKKPAFGGYV